MSVRVDALEPGSVAWSALVTASKIPGIYGQSKYSSPTKEFYLLRGEIPPDDDNDAMERGRDFEPVILERFFRRHPELIRLPHGSFTLIGLDWAAATPDATATDEHGRLLCIEAKTDGRGDYEWGTPGTDEIPLGFYLQTQWQMHMTGARRTIVVRLGPFYDEDEYTVVYDAEQAADMEDYAGWFHRNALDPNGQPPDVDGNEHTYDAIRRANSLVDYAADDWDVGFELAREFDTALLGFDGAQEALHLAKSKLLRTMGTARRAVIGEGKNTQVVATRQRTKKGVAIYKARKPIDWAAAGYIPSDEQAA